MTDILHVPQPGKLVDKGRRVQVGEFKRYLDRASGKYSAKYVLTKRYIPVGDGVEVLGSGPTVVTLAITAAAAKRLGIPHPANPPELTENDVARLSGIINSETYGQQERCKAIVDLEAAGYTVQMDPKLRAWLFGG